MKTISLAVLAVAALSGSAALAAKQAPHAKLTMTHVRVIALKLAPGTIAEAEYEALGSKD